MSRIFILLSLTSLCVLGGCGLSKTNSSPAPETAAERAQWKPFVSKKGKFSMLLPGVPTAKPSVIQTEIGPVKGEDFMLKAVQGKYKAGYLMSYANYPEKKNMILNPKKILDLLWAEESKSFKDKIIYKKQIKSDEIIGVEYQYNGVTNPDMLVMGRNYVVGNRLYQLTAVMRKEQFKRGDAIKALDSFQLID